MPFERVERGHVLDADVNAIATANKHTEFQELLDGDASLLAPSCPQRVW